MKNKYQEPINKNKEDINNYKNKIDKEEIINYQEKISKYTVSNEVKEKILTKINQQFTSRFKMAYSIIPIVLTCLISVGIVYAKDIKEFITSWGRTKVTYYDKEGTKQEVELNPIKTVKTNLDDFVFEKEIYTKLDILPDDYPIPVEGITLFKNKKIKEITEELGVHILGLDRLNYKYLYKEITKERKIGTIFIRSDEYVVQCGTKAGKESCSPLAHGYKGFSMTIELKTTNTNLEYDNEWSYDSSHGGDLQIKKFNKIGDIEVDGFSHVLSIIGNNGTEEGFVTEMYFNCENIRYTINATNLSHEELLDILEETLQ